ncbi:MAG: universal stress protein [Thermodesulfovibrionales bacterium]
MYKHILAAVNEHLNSEIAARYAVHLARASGARLFFCFIDPKDLPRRDFGRAEEALQRLFLEAQEAGVAAESITGAGDPVREIGKIARQKMIDLVFASTRREDVERRFYAGTVGRRLSLGLPCSVALVRVAHFGRIHPGKILVPLKARISRIRERAYFTAKLASAFGSQVYVYHVARPMSSFLRGEVHLTPAEWERKRPADISAFLGLLRHANVLQESRSVAGRSGKSIAVEAVARRHDLIVMGASERSLWSSLIRGNPVERMLRETPCDLIILTPRRHED